MQLFMSRMGEWTGLIDAEGTPSPSAASEGGPGGEAVVWRRSGEPQCVPTLGGVHAAGRVTTMRNRVVLAAVLAVVLLGLPASEAASSGHVQEFVTFDPGASGFLEGIRFDKTGNGYVSMIFLGQIRRISPDGSQSVVATIPAPASESRAWRTRRGVTCTSPSPRWTWRRDRPIPASGVCTW